MEAAAGGKNDFPSPVESSEPFQETGDVDFYQNKGGLSPLTLKSRVFFSNSIITRGAQSFLFVSLLSVFFPENLSFSKLLP